MLIKVASSGTAVSGVYTPLEKWVPGVLLPYGKALTLQLPESALKHTSRLQQIFEEPFSHRCHPTTAKTKISNPVAQPTKDNYGQDN